MKLILIVDDDPSLGRLLEFALQKAGFGVMIARDGKEGLKLASEFHPDAAILDVQSTVTGWVEPEPIPFAGSYSPPGEKLDPVFQESTHDPGGATTVTVASP